MRRFKSNEPRQFDVKALGLFIKTVREGHGRSLLDVARDAGVNRPALHNLESGSNLPYLRTIEAVCRQISLGAIDANVVGYGGRAGSLVGGRHLPQEELDALSEADALLVAGVVKLLRKRSNKPMSRRRKLGHSDS